MKKLDFVMIILVLLIGVSVFTVYFKKFNVNLKSAKVAIYYHELLLDSIDFEENINFTYTIESENNNILKVTKNDGNEDTIITYPIPEKVNFFNILGVTYDRIEMIDASCPNRRCLDMFMNRQVKFPIICTNGVIVMFTSIDDFEVIVP